MLDKPEVMVEITKQPRFLPWDFDTEPYMYVNTISCKRRGKTT